jgi:hypothetical protein
MRRIAVICALAVAVAAAFAPAAQRGQRFAAGLGGCKLLPRGDAFHRDVSGLPEAGNSEAVIDRILADGGDHLHPDFGSNPHYGIPYAVVGARKRRVRVRIVAYPGESDRGRHPIPRRAPVEGGRRSDGDRHVLVLQRDGRDRDDDCRLIELYRAFKRPGSRRWRADQASVFDLGRRLPQRPDGWTSADAAGLPILPGLVRYREVKAGRIKHAIRMTVERTRRAYLSPATHFASEECGATLPPMGMRLRLGSGYPLGDMTGPARVVGRALKTYGAIIADNGSNFFISGASDRRWNDEALNDLKSIPGDAFEVVATGAELTHDC